MIFLTVLAAFIIMLLAYCYTETLHFKVTDYFINDRTVPEDLKGKKLVLLSDLHGKIYGKDNSKLFNAVKSASPDCIIIAGDLVNGYSEKDFEYASFFLDSLNALNIPVYYSFGNHELEFIPEMGKSAYHKYKKLVAGKCRLLVNKSDNLLSNVDIYGLTLHRRRYKGKPQKHLNKLSIERYIDAPDINRYNILIAHDPCFSEKYFNWGADIVLSGHLHGGIIRLPFLGGIISPRFELFPRCDKGHYTINNHHLIVSGGLGWHGIPFRFLNIPEIVTITFSKEVT